MKLDFYRQIFKKSSNIKFQGNSSSNILGVPSEGPKDTIMLTAALRSCTKAPKTSGSGNTVMKHSPSAVITPEKGLLFLKLKFAWKK
jgi:hypothetical protein